MSAPVITPQMVEAGAKGEWEAEREILEERDDVCLCLWSEWTYAPDDVDNEGLTKAQRLACWEKGLQAALAAS